MYTSLEDRIGERENVVFTIICTLYTYRFGLRLSDQLTIIGTRHATTLVMIEMCDPVALVGFRDCIHFTIAFQS